MKKSWALAAALAVLFASPALSQDRGRDRDNRPDNDRGGAERGAPPAQSPPAQPRQQAPQAQPQQPQQGRDFGRGRDNGPQQNAQGNDRARPDRGNDRFARPDQGRDFRDNRGFDNGRGNNAFNNGRRDFRQFNRVYNAPRRFRAPAYHPPRGYFVRRWTFGERLPPTFWVRDYWLLDYFDFGLPPPPPGTLWVRVGSDALLIDRFDGEIIEVVYNVFF